MDCSPPHPYEESSESDNISDTDGMDEVHGRVRTHSIYYGGMKDMTNEYKMAWLQQVGTTTVAGGQKKNRKRGYIKRHDLMRLVKTSSGTGKGKFERIFLPMVEHVADVAAVIAPFTDAHMKVIAIRRINKRLSA